MTGGDRKHKQRAAVELRVMLKNEERKRRRSECMESAGEPRPDMLQAGTGDALSMGRASHPPHPPSATGPPFTLGLTQALPWSAKSLPRLAGHGGRPPAANAFMERPHRGGRLPCITPTGNRSRDHGQPCRKGCCPPHEHISWAVEP